MNRKDLIFENTKKFFDNLAHTWDKVSEVAPKKLQQLIDYCNIQPNDKVLDIACGTGIIDKLISKKTTEKIVGIDISSEMLERAKQKNQDINIEYLNENFYFFEQSGFDKAIIFNAYPHFIDKPKFAKKLAQVLNKNGSFIIMHDESADKINSRHLGTKEVVQVSKPLQNVDNEVLNFTPYFNIIKAIDNNDMVFIMGQKK